MTSYKDNIKSIFALVLALIAILVAIYVTRPVSIVMYSNNTSLSSLDSQQRKNVCLAARNIDRTYIDPGMQFSFNKTVGPRNAENGFATSKTYFEGSTINSEGGGICFLSSAIYNAALRANLKITNRTAHTRPINSFPLGLDATVWYGINDLKFINNTKGKIRIEAKCEFDNLNVTIKGRYKFNEPDILIKKSRLSFDKLRVKTYRKTLNRTELISDDIYILNK